MEEKKNVEKLSYEQLENAAAQLQQRVATLQNQLNGINSAMYRLNFLFKVLEVNKYFPEDFLKSCADEVMDLMIIKDDEEPAEDTEDTKE